MLSVLEMIIYLLFPIHLDCWTERDVINNNNKNVGATDFQVQYSPNQHLQRHEGKASCHNETNPAKSK